MEPGVLIGRNLFLELTFSASRSSGPGGQSVNKVSSKVELRFNIAGSSVLTDAEKGILLDRLKKRVNAEGEIVLVCQTERTQLMNKAKVLEKFYSLLEKALAPRKKRIKTAPTKSSVEKRIEKKKALSEKKLRRKESDLPDQDIS
jgi:ribosome-associated protein